MAEEAAAGACPYAHRKDVLAEGALLDRKIQANPNASTASCAAGTRCTMTPASIAELPLAFRPRG
jgi:hypothetical protein